MVVWNELSENWLATVFMVFKRGNKTGCSLVPTVGKLIPQNQQIVRRTIKLDTICFYLKKKLSFQHYY